MYNKTITVRCESAHIDSVDGDLIDVRLYNMTLADLLCEFNIDEIADALVEADKSAEVIEILNSNDSEED